MQEYIAQASLVPGNGASNAQDFQPGTRNPQGSTSSNLQQTTPLQNTNNQDALLDGSTDSSTRILVPTENAPQSSQTGTQGDVNYSFLVGGLIVAVLILAFAHFIRKLGRVRILPTEETNDIDDEVVAVEKKPAKTQTKKPKKTTKSKKKRKHR